MSSSPRDPAFSGLSSRAEPVRTEERVGELLRDIQKRDHAQLDPAWLDTVDRVFGPLRFALHDLQMAACVAGRLTPDANVAAACAEQAASETRKIRRLSHRFNQLAQVHPDVGRTSGDRWRTADEWQPLRRTLDRLLVTADFRELLVGSNLAVLPMVDELFLVHCGNLAEQAGDPSLAKILRELHTDARLHREWTRGFVSDLLSSSTDRSRVHGWLLRWKLRASDSVSQFAALFGTDADHVLADVHATQAALVREMGL